MNKTLTIMLVAVIVVVVFVGGFFAGMSYSAATWRQASYGSLGLQQGWAGMMQGANSMMQGANMMLLGQGQIRQGMIDQGYAVMMQGSEMMRQGSAMMEQGQGMMQQASGQIQPGSWGGMMGMGNMMQGSGTMMQGAGYMLDSAKSMMQAREMMLQGANKVKQGDQSGYQMMEQAAAVMNQGVGMMGQGGWAGWQGQGMMGGGMMGGMMGGGMMGGMMGWSTGQITSLDDAAKAAQSFVARLNNPDLVVKDLMEFQYNYYFIVYEKSTGIGAFEMLIMKQGGGMMGGGMMGGGTIGGGFLHPEPGPNMMWNTKYNTMGMMGGPLTTSSTSPAMTVSKEQAKQYAQNYLNKTLPGAVGEDVDQFYGYYTLHIEKDGKIYGMLSVNGYTGQVWYHNWHGTFIQMQA